MPELAPWASDARASRGRRIAEPGLAHEQAYRIDRERIVHCTAFRRLVYKTQVFINHEGDLFRTRLTHSLEVAQLARSMAREMRLNEDLVEAIALAHDLGHTPFGHAGQDALHDCMRAHGGFEHNLQSLRVVDLLEQCHAGFDGLNLCFETREGILKHCSRAHAHRLEQGDPGGVGWRFLHGAQPSLEAQLVNLADEMAYNAHDIDDGVRSGLITAEQLLDVALYRRFRDEALAASPSLAAGGRRLLFDSVRRMREALAGDLVATTQGLLLQQGIVQAGADAQAVRQAPPLVAFSTPMRMALAELKRFLFSALYRHEQVQRSTERARQVVAELFMAYLERPAEMPAEHAAQPLRERAVADYIAGMTDRFALREHQRLTGRALFADAA
jgi:dGTPase